MSRSSSKVFVRSLQHDDAKALFHLLSHPLVTEKLPDEDHISSLDQAQRVLEEMIQDTCNRRRFCKALASSQNQTLIGTLIANHRNLERQSAYIAYDLDPSYWGRGLMIEGLKLFLPSIQDVFFLKTIKAKTTIDNYRSQRVLEKLGFKKEKEFEYHKPINGRYVHAFLYTLTLNE